MIGRISVCWKFCSTMGSWIVSWQAVAARCRLGRGMGGKDWLWADADVWWIFVASLGGGACCWWLDICLPSILLLLAGSFLLALLQVACHCWGFTRSCLRRPRPGDDHVMWQSSCQCLLPAVCWFPAVWVVCRGVHCGLSLVDGVAGAGAGLRRMC